MKQEPHLVQALFGEKAATKITKTITKIAKTATKTAKTATHKI